MILRLLILLFTFPTIASPLEDEKSIEQEIVKIYNHVLISREESYPGNHLCHDGEFLYFKSLDFCRFSKGVECHSLRISPLAEIEDIYLSEDKKEKLTRFYSLSLKYQLGIFEKTKNQEWDYSLKEYVDQEVLTCNGKTIEDTVITYFERTVANKTEKAFLQAVYRSGFSVINSPKGRIEKLTFADNESPLLNWEKIDDKLKKNISSPECQPKVDEGVLKLLSGELSGNGINSEILVQLQSLSEPLERDNNKSLKEEKVKCNEGVWI